MPENVKLHPHENCNCDRDGVALPPEIVLEVKNLTKKFQVDGGKVLTACDAAITAESFARLSVCAALPQLSKTLSAGSPACL